LLRSWTERIKEKTNDGHTPLHCAVGYGASKEVVSLLLSRCPEAIKEQDNDGQTPLHFACCRCMVPIEVVSMLLSRWPEGIKEKDKHGRTHLLTLYPASDSDKATNDVKILLSHVSTIYSDEDNKSSIIDILSFCIRIEWRSGVLLLIDRHPNITKSFDLHTHVMADFLSVIGKGCSRRTMWEIIENEQDLLNVGDY